MNHCESASGWRNKTNETVLQSEKLHDSHADLAVDHNDLAPPDQPLAGVDRRRFADVRRAGPPIRCEVPPRRRDLAASVQVRSADRRCSAGVHIEVLRLFQDRDRFDAPLALVNKSVNWLSNMTNVLTARGPGETTAACNAASSICLASFRPCSAR